MRLTDARFSAIIADIATHGRARKALRDRGVNPRSFWAKLAADPEAAKRYARAKELGLASFAEEIADLSDDVAESKESIDKARLQVETRKWLLARLIPSKYGERTVIAGDAENPLRVEHTDAVEALLSRPCLTVGLDGTTGPDGETIQ